MNQINNAYKKYLVVFIYCLFFTKSYSQGSIPKPCNLYILCENHKYQKENDQISLAFINKLCHDKETCDYIDEIPVSAGFMINSYVKANELHKLKSYLKKVYELNLSYSLIRKIKSNYNVNIQIKGFDIEHSYKNVFYFIHFLVTENNYLQKYSEFKYFNDVENIYDYETNIRLHINNFWTQYNSDPLKSQNINSYEIAIINLCISTFKLNINSDFMQAPGFDSKFEKRDSAISEIISFHLKEATPDERIIVRIGSAHFNKDDLWKDKSQMKIVKSFLEEKNICFNCYYILYNKVNTNLIVNESYRYNNSLYTEYYSINENRFFIKKNH